MMGLHPTGEVGLARPLPQPDNIAANARHTRIRITMMKNNVSDGPSPDQGRRLIREAA
jgi:hypothetical protein